jgi:hypothetical protein
VISIGPIFPIEAFILWAMAPGSEADSGLAYVLELCTRSQDLHCHASTMAELSGPTLSDALHEIVHQQWLISDVIRNSGPS